MRRRTTGEAGGPSNRHRREAHPATCPPPPVGGAVHWRGRGSSKLHCRGTVHWGGRGPSHRVR
eukprot:10194236-Alexandrium_andersonii.AAC.1